MKINLAAFGMLALVFCPRVSPAAPVIRLDVDLRDAPRKILHAHLQIPVSPGPLTLFYPKWLPGEHSPSGPIDNLAGLVLMADGKTVSWRRDDVDMFAFHVDVPADAHSLDVRLDFLATAAPQGYSAGASVTGNLAILSWNDVLLYPSGIPAHELQVIPSVTLPANWHFATALSRDGATREERTAFAAVRLNTLIDSPLLCGRFFREIALAPEITPPHFLDVAADAPEDLDVSKEEIEHYENLVRETGALFGKRHYTSYHFLMTLSDNVAHFGLEHHQSSDDRVEAKIFSDDNLRLLAGDLLPHEFTHSWNGKYKRPAGLITKTYQEPMRGELLWIYEGLTQYLGGVLATRSGIWSEEEYRDYLAVSAADMQFRPGRTWRSLEDTAVAAQTLGGTSSEWDSWRRSTDYYSEGELLWLEVDTIIRQRSGGKRSLDDFCARFFGDGPADASAVVPYNLQDVARALTATEPYEWMRFFHEHLTSHSGDAPLKGISQAGYRLDFVQESNTFTRARESSERGGDAWYSLGIRFDGEGDIADVRLGSPADKAQLGPNMRIIAMNGRRANAEQMRRSLREAKTDKPIQLIVEYGGYYTVKSLTYQGGERHPTLRTLSDVRLLLPDILRRRTHPAGEGKASTKPTALPAQ